jgi:hypothetical protein
VSETSQGIEEPMEEQAERFMLNSVFSLVLNVMHCIS